MSIWTELRAVVSEFFPHRSNQRSDRDSGSSGSGTSQTLGYRGERAAERFLKKLGYRIVACGYHNHVGEIDLIAVDMKEEPKTVVFVEGKTRQSDFRGQPIEAVDDRKQRQISETALVYLKQHRLLESRFRFDVIGIIWPEETGQPVIEHYVDAFPPVGRGQLFS